MTGGEHAERERTSEGPPAEPVKRTAVGALDADEVYHLLRSRRRRLVLRYLRGSDGPHELRDVAERVAAWEHDTTLEALRSEERQRVYISLYQTHLPSLDEAGVIEYERRRGIVEPTERVDRLYDVLAVEGRGAPAAGDGSIAPAGRDRVACFGSASLLSVGLLTAAWAGLVALPGVAVATVVTVLFGVLTVGVVRGG